MPSTSGAYRLTFNLPASLLLRVPHGRHQPCVHGCVLRVDPGGFVAIDGAFRDNVLEQALRFMRVNCRGVPPFSVPATLRTPPQQPYGRGGVDTWQIIVGADVAIVPSPHTPRLAVAPNTILAAG